MSCREDFMSCFEDCCDRQTQFCNEKEQRCQNCHDRQVMCGNHSMPQACDVFCYKLQLSQSTLPYKGCENVQGYSYLEIAGLVSMCLLGIVIFFALYTIVRRPKWLKRILKTYLSHRTDPKKVCDTEGVGDQETLLDGTQSVLDTATHCDREWKAGQPPRVSEPETTDGTRPSLHRAAAAETLGVSSTSDTPTQENNYPFDDSVKSGRTSSQTSSNSLDSNDRETDLPSSFRSASSATKLGQTAVYIPPASGSKPAQTSSDNSVDEGGQPRQTNPNYSANGCCQAFSDYHVNSKSRQPSSSEDPKTTSPTLVVIPTENNVSAPPPTVGTIKPTTAYMS